MTGKLIVIGGGEVKKSSTQYKSQLISQIFSERNIKNITVILPPSEPKRKGVNKYEDVFKKITGKAPEFLFLEENPKKNGIEKIEAADLIFFGGGQQRKFIEALSSDFVKVIQNRFKQDNVFIAGTSAGAMIFTDKIISEGGNAGAQVDEKLKMLSGFNLFSVNVRLNTSRIKKKN